MNPDIIILFVKGVILFLVCISFLFYSATAFHTLYEFAMNYHLPKAQKCLPENCGFYFVNKDDQSIFWCLNPRVSKRKFDKLRKVGKRCYWSIARFEPLKSDSLPDEKPIISRKLRDVEDYLNLYLQLSSRDNTLAIALKTSLALASIYFTIFYGLPAEKNILNNLISIIGGK